MLELELSDELAYIEPPVHVVTGAETIPRALDRVWGDVVAAADRPPFRLVAQNEAIGFVVVAFDAMDGAHPARETFDCGRVTRTIVEDGERQELAYALGDAAVDREVIAGEEDFVVRDLRLSPSLDARATLYLKPSGEGQTRVTVNARYALTIEVSGEEVRVPRSRLSGSRSARSIEVERWQARFKSFEPGRFAGDPAADPYRCRATGVLEDWLLSLARGDAKPSDPAGV
jgi:hypothetical protein